MEAEMEASLSFKMPERRHVFRSISRVKELEWAMRLDDSSACTSHADQPVHTRSLAKESEAEWEE